MRPARSVKPVTRRGRLRMGWDAGGRSGVGWYDGRPHAPVAQLDRVLASEAKGRAFESRRARQTFHPRYRWYYLLLKSPRAIPIALVSSRERKRRQPGLAADGPEFVGRRQLVRRIQRSQVHFDFVCAACENGRAAARTEDVARRSRVFRRRSSRHPEGRSRTRGTAPRGACGSLDSDRGRPGMGVPTQQFARCRTGNRR